jgi:hypothetical protein
VRWRVRHKGSVLRVEDVGLSIEEEEEEEEVLLTAYNK